MKYLARFSLISIAIVPLLVDRGVLVPFVSLKNLFFRAMVLLAMTSVTILTATDSSFRKNCTDRIAVLWKNPLIKLLLGLVVSLVVSTLFAYNTHYAVFGYPLSGEGLVGLVWYFLYCILLCIVFNRSEWFAFFKVTLGTSIILSIGQFIETSHQIIRSGSFAGNPIYLGTYYLFVFFAALIVIREAIRRRQTTVVWYASISFIFAFVGFFITQSRGTIVGLVVALCIAGIQISFSKTKVFIGSISLQKWIRIGFAIGIGAIILLVCTRNAAFWKDIPVANRFAQIGLEDQTTRARLININISLHAVNPTVVGMRRFLVGWGWDNYIFAWQKFYDPHLYFYDIGFFDHPHNKLLDQLVTTGVIGLAVYVLLWIVLFKSIYFVRHQSKYVFILLLVWSVSYFVQNLFVFDVAITWITFFTMLGLIVFLQREKLYVR